METGSYMQILWMPITQTWKKSMPFPTASIGVPKTGWCSGSTDPATMHRHTYSGGVIASVASLDLVKIPSILAPPSARYHILKMFTSPVLRIANGRQTSLLEMDLGRSLDHDRQYRSKT